MRENLVLEISTDLLETVNSVLKSSLLKLSINHRCHSTPSPLFLGLFLSV